MAFEIRDQENDIWIWDLARPALTLIGVVPLLAVACLDLSATGLYALATRHGLLSEVAVASALYPLATVVLARIVLGERVRRVQEVGIVAAVVGVAMIAT